MQFLRKLISLRTAWGIPNPPRNSRILFHFHFQWTWQCRIYFVPRVVKTSIAFQVVPTASLSSSSLQGLGVVVLLRVLRDGLQRFVVCLCCGRVLVRSSIEKDHYSCHSFSAPEPKAPRRHLLANESFACSCRRRLCCRAYICDSVDAELK